MNHLFKVMILLLCLCNSAYATDTTYVHPPGGILPEDSLALLVNDLITSSAPKQEVKDIVALKYVGADEYVGRSGYVFDAADEYLKPALMPLPPDEDTGLAETLAELGTGGYSADIKKARKAIEKAQLAGNIISTLNGGDLASLPLLLEKEVGNVTVSIVFNSMVLTPTHTELEIFAKIRTPQKSVAPDGTSLNYTEIFFGAKGIKYSQDGGFAQDVKLMLLGPLAFELGGQGNKKTAIILLPPKAITALHPNNTIYSQNVSEDENEETGGTYLTFDCDGVKEFGIEANIFFSRDWIIPIDANNMPIPGKRVKGHVQTIVQDWNNMLFEKVEITNFMLKNKPDFFFALGNANVDMSDYANPSTAKFPEGYLDVYDADPNDDIPASAQLKNLWRGVYIGKLSITLPKMFKKRCDGFDGTAGTTTTPPDPTTTTPPAAPPSPCGIIIQGEDMIIDGQGVSGRYSVIGQAPLIEGGQMNKAWNWSLDAVTIHLDKSQFAGFSFTGGISIPLADKNTPLSYYASWVDNTYVFKIALQGQDIPPTVPPVNPIKKQELMKFPVFKAGEVTLYDGTELEVIVEDDEFKPSLRLYGYMTIGHPSVDTSAAKQVKLPTVRFNNLILSTTEPYIKLGDQTAPGSIAVESGDCKVMNFPVTAHDFALTNYGGDKVKFNFSIDINLIEAAKGGLRADGDFAIIGKLSKDGNGSHRWQFEKFEFGGAEIELVIPTAMMIKGRINIFNKHPVYGDGFGAALEGRFVGKGTDFSDPKFKATVAIMFGTKDDYRYFMVDGFVRFGSPTSGQINLTPTPYFLNGFGGGASYHMKPIAYSKDPTKMLPGQDATGLIYAPSKETGLGVKIATSFTDNVSTNGTLTLMIRFSPNWALQNIMFWGVVDIILTKEAGPVADEKSTAGIQDAQANMTKTEEEKAQADQLEAHNKADKISAHIGISLDFTDGFTFHAFADLYMNMPSIKLTGRGTLDMLIADSKTSADGAVTPAVWHLYVGGYNDGSVTYPDFFTGSKVKLYPVQVAIQFSNNLKVSAKSYFLTGNDIPGPPPIDPEIREKFGMDTSVPATNRGKLDQGFEGSSRANGLGFAFGAQAKFELTLDDNTGTFCWQKKKLLAVGGVGFDISLLKYAKGTECPSTADGNPETYHGIDYFRATGRIYAYIDIKGSKVYCVPIPSLGAGLYAEADVTNPTYFNCRAYINFITRLTMNLEIGDKCGGPCNN